MSQPTYSELRRLQELQHSLKSMQTKISYLLKEKQKNQKNVQKALKSSMSQIESKMTQARFYEQMRILQQKKDNKRSDLHDSIIKFKEKQKNDLHNIKTNIRENKYNESMALKAISKKNDHVIRQNRRKNIEEKKNIVQQIKNLKQQTRRQLQNKRDEKLQLQKKQRQEQIAERLRQKTKIQRKMKQLSEMQNQLKGKISQSQYATRTIQTIGKQSVHIQKDQFYKIIKEVRKENGGYMSQQELKSAIFEKFLKSKTQMSLPQIQQGKKILNTTTSQDQNVTITQPLSISQMQS